MSEEEIIQGVLSYGAVQRKALEAFYQGIGRHMRASFVHWGASSDDAADILQETAVRLFRYAASYQGRGTASAWLWQIARNSFIDHFRVKRVTGQPATAKHGDAAHQSEPDPDGEAIDSPSTLVGDASPANETTPSRRVLFVPVETVDDELQYIEPDIPAGALDQCVQEGLKAFAAEYPERQLCLFLQMEGASVDEIAAQIGRKPGATREFLSQCRKKLEPFVTHCRELIPA
jgi:RNA polymerase sigma factor (sigma-70 family)